MNGIDLSGYDLSEQIIRREPAPFSTTSLPPAARRGDVDLVEVLSNGGEAVDG